MEATKMNKKLFDLQKKYCPTDSLPFSDILNSDEILRLIDAKKILNSRDRIFPPIVVISAFIKQIMNEDISCAQVVLDLCAERAAKGLPPICANTAGFCQARLRLPEDLIKDIAISVGQNTDSKAEKKWKWKGLNVKLVDGTTLSMADTAANQKVYPQAETQVEGIGFPIARAVGVTSLTTGTLLGFSIGPYAGKETGEHALFRQILDNCFDPGDVCLGDRYYCSYFLIAMLAKKNVNFVSQIHAGRNYDLEQGKAIGKNDCIVEWKRPPRPEWMSEAEYEEMPLVIKLRQTMFGELVIISTFLDAKKITRKNIKKLYKGRWNIETDLLFLKDILQMGILRSKTPSMVRKEIYATILAYNLIRTVIAQAAKLNKKIPREISFKGAKQAINSYAIFIQCAKKNEILKLYKRMLADIASRKIGNRPGRSEPREVKRRPKAYPRMTKPRKASA